MQYNLNSSYFYRSKVLSLFLLGSFFMFSCEKKEKDDPIIAPSVADTYKLTSATLSSDLPNYANLTKGSDVLGMVKTALFSTFKCDTATNAAFDLRDNKELYFVCDNEDGKAKAGTWSVDSEDTELTLNLALPLFPVAISLVMADLNINSTSISGNIAGPPGLPGLPVPKWVVDGVAPPTEPTDSLNFPVPDFNVDLVFERL